MQLFHLDVVCSETTGENEEQIHSDLFGVSQVESFTFNL